MEKQIKKLVDKFGYIKVNLPENGKGYNSGNGEGVWAVACTKEDNKVSISEFTTDYKKEFYVFICNSSLYHPKLEWGSKVRCENRGSNRAVAVFNKIEQ